MHITLCAPTGIAAHRMSTVIGEKAVTIHRLLGMRRKHGVSHLSRLAGENIISPTRFRDEMLETDLVIVDEMSMVDVSLLFELLRFADYLLVDLSAASEAPAQCSSSAMSISFPRSGCC